MDELPAKLDRLAAKAAKTLGQRLLDNFLSEKWEVVWCETMAKACIRDALTEFAGSLTGRLMVEGVDQMRPLAVQNLGKVLRCFAYTTRLAARTGPKDLQEDGMVGVHMLEKIAAAVEAQDWMTVNSLCEQMPGVEDIPADDALDLLEKFKGKATDTPTPPLPDDPDTGAPTYG